MIKKNEMKGGLGMNIKRRYQIAILIVAILVIPAIANEQPSGKPFDAIWQEINGIKSTIANLQEQINNVQLIPGPQGPKGDPGISGYEIITKTATVDGESYGEDELICPDGKKIIGGGYDYGLASEITVVSSRPNDSKDGWIVGAFSDYAYGLPIKIYAICANVQ